ncbi:VCBS domain-containing protein [Limnohabitans sp. MORI2]|uniref:beta strand repeat-containing protein n=1 Tax=Limnohabitans sp. MORI2 TaxID=1751150 RepID=UPI002493B5C8|nr:VCBS domain-containing protein [Limnohabitans sp. MORI2]
MSGKKDLNKLAAALPLTAVLVEEVRAAQAKNQSGKAPAEAVKPQSANEQIQLDVNQGELVLDSAAIEEQASAEQSVQDAAANARDSLRAVLQDEIASAQATASASKIDPAAPDAGHQAIRSVLNDEINYEVAKALDASPKAAEVLAKLPDVSLPQGLTANLGAFPTGGAAAVAVAALGGGGGGVVSSAVSVVTGGSQLPPAVQLAFSGAAIDGYVQGATVNYQVKVNGVWTTVATTVTDAKGGYSFTGLDASYATGRVVIAGGGYDANTGQQVGEFISNASASEAGGYQAATPLTMILALSGLTEDEFKAQLGISEVADLGSFDPVEAMKTGNAALGEKVFSLQQGVYTLLQAASTVAGGGVSTSTSLNDAVAAVGKVIAANYAADLGVISLHDLTVGAIKEVAVGTYANAVTHAINLTNEKIAEYYTGLADAFREDPPSVESQSTIAGAKAAASVSQSSLLSALAVGTEGAVAAFESSFQAELTLQVNAFKEVAALAASDQDLTSTIANPVFLVQQALQYTGGLPTSTQIKDLAGEFTQISLAKLIDLNVSNVTLLGTNDRVELLMQGNGSTNTDAELATKLQDGLFASKYTVTLRVNDGDIAQLLKQLQTVDLHAVGIDMLKPIAGTLKISKADAISLIDEGLSFATGSFQLKPGDSLSFADVQKLVIDGGLKLADNTTVDLSGADVQLDTDTAFDLIAAGAKFTNADNLSLLLEARHLNGNAQAVVDKLLSLVGVGDASTGLSYVFDTSSRSPASGVTFTSGKLALSGLTLTEAQASALVHADISQSVKFSNTAISFSNTAYAGKVDAFVAELKDLFKAGIKDFTVTGDVSKDIATKLLNIDSSVVLHATVTEPLTASIAMGFAARGITPTNVNFDIDYVKNYILVDGNKLTSTITVNVPFSDDTITPTDFVNLIAAGVRFQSGIGSVLIKDTDTAFTMGSDAVANQLKLVNAGLKLALGSAPLTDASLTLANAQKLQAAHVNAADQVFGDITLQLSSADMAAANLKATLAALSYHDLNVRPISGSLTAAQVDALQTVKPGSPVHFEFASLQLDATSVAVAAQKAANYYSGLGITTAVVSATGMTYAQASALSAAGITKVNAGLVVTLDASAATGHFANLDSLAAMGFTKLSVPATSAITKAQFDEIIAEYPKFTFEPGSKIDLSDAANPGLVGTTLAKAAIYSAAGLTLTNMDTLAAKDISLSQAVSLAAKGAHFTSEVKGETLVIYKEANTATKTYLSDLSLNQVKSLFNAVAGGTDVVFKDFTSLRVSSTELGNLDAAMVAKLAKAGLPGISLIDSPSLTQVLKLSGSSLQFVGPVTLADKSITSVNDALVAIAKGAVFSGASLILKDTAALTSMISGGDLDGKPIGILKAKGVTTLDLSGSGISVQDATTLMNWGGIKFVNTQLLTGTTPIDVAVVGNLAALGVSVPSTAVISSSTNSVTFDQAYAVASNGGSIALKTGSNPVTAHVTVDATGKTALTYTEAATVLSKVQNAEFSGVNSIQLAAKNADFAAVVALAGKLQDAGIISIKLATGAALSVNIGQLQTLTTEGVSFVSGSDVRLQLTSGDLSAQFTAIGGLGSNTAGVGFIKAAGASLTLSSADFDKVTNGMKFVPADMVTVQVSSLNSSDLARYNTAGVDFVGAVGGKITISATAAQGVVDANTVKLLPTDVVTVSLNSTELNALTSGSVAAFKAVGVDNFAVATVNNVAPSVPLSAVKAILANQLSFTSNVTVDVPVTDAADLTYVIDNSGSLAGAGVKQVHVTGGEASLTMKQLSSLLAAGTGGVKFVDNIKVSVNTAADLAYFASSATDIQALQPVKELSLDASIINIPLATAQLLAKSYHLTPPATVSLDFAAATQLTQADVTALNSAGFVTFNFGGISVDPSAQLDAFVAKLTGAGYKPGELPVEVTGIMVNTTFAKLASAPTYDADKKLADFGFKDNTGFINKPSLNLVSAAAEKPADGDLLFDGKVFKVFDKGDWTEAKTIISPTGVAVKVIATNSDNAITSAELKALTSLTGGKLSFTGINLQLKDVAEATGLTAKTVTAYKAVGITSVDAGSLSGWDVKTVTAVQSAGLKFANVNSAKITDATVNLNDYQAMKGLGFTFNATTLLRDKAVDGTLSAPSLTAAVAQQLLVAKDIGLSGVVIKDGSLSASTALSLSKAGLIVSNVLVSGNVSVDDALALLNPSSTNSAPTFAVKGFFSGNTLTTTATKQTIDIDQALKLTKVLGLGDVRIKVEAGSADTPGLLPKLATLLAQDPSAKFATGSFLTCDSLTLSQAKQLFSLGGGLVSTGASGVELKLTLDSSNSNFSEILGVAQALKVKVIDCDSKPLTLSTTQYADYVASKITLEKVSGNIQLTVASPEDITYVVNNAVTLKGKVNLVTTGTSLTLTNEQFATYQAAGAAGVKFANTVAISVSLTQDQLDASNLASTLATLKAANVAGVVCLADKGLSNAAVTDLIKSGVTVLGSPTLKVQPEPEKVGELFSAGFNVQVTPDLTNVSISKALTLAAIDGVKTVSLVSGASELTVSQSDWLNPSARAIIDKVLLSTGSKPAMNITGVEAGKVESLLAEQGVIIKQLALQAGQSIITSTSQWDGRWTELTTGQNPKVIGLADANVTIAGVSSQSEVIRLASQTLVDKVYLSSSSGFKLDASNLTADDVASLAKVYYAGGAVSVINSLALKDIGSVTEDTNIASASLFTNDLSVGSSTLAKSVASIQYGSDSYEVRADVATKVSTPYGDLFINADGSYSFTTGGAANALVANAQQDLIFSYTVNNGTTVESSALTVRISGVNDAPVATFTAAQAVLEDATISGQLTSTDVDTVHSATYSLVGDPITGLTINADGSWTFDASSYDSLSKDATLPITVNYLVTDDKGATSTNSFVITVTGTNDAPTATFTAAQPVLEDTTISGQLTSTDVDTVHSATYSLVGDPITGLTINSNGSWTFDASSYDSLSKDATLPITVNYLVTDDKGATSTNSFVITVTGTNDAPTATFTAAQPVLEDATISGQLTSTDVDTVHSATYSLVGDPITGLTINSNGSWTFDASSYDSLSKDATFPITVNYLVTDDKGATSTNSFVITVTGTNDAPTATFTAAQPVLEDATISGQLTSTDVDTVHSATYSLVGDPITGLTINADGSWTFDASSYDSLSKDAQLPITVNYLVTDDLGLTSTNSFVITVTGTNDAPTATFTAAQAVLEDATISGQLTSTDVDTAHTATYSLVGDPITGLTINSNGSWTFDASSYDSLSKDAQLPITVNYLVTDDLGLTSTNSFVITVTGTNDAPQLSVSSQAQNVTEDQTVGVPSLQLLNGVATDVDSTTLSIQGPTVTAFMVDSAGNHISTVATFPSVLPLTPTTGAALWLDGTQLKINPAAEAFQFLNDGQKLEVSVSYKIADIDGGESSTATASFTVAGKSEGTSFSAKVIDGYVQGARVFYDTDGDGKYDVGEAFAITDAEGNYKLFVDNDKLVAGGKGNLIAELDWKEGEVEHFATDKFTGKILTGDLIAPEGFTYITPLTTLVALTVEKGQDPVVLAKSIANGLGLTASLQNYDPFASMTSTNPAVAAQAELVFKAQQMVFTVMQAATTALVEASPTLSNPLLTMAKAVTSAITTGKPAADLSDTLSAVSTSAINTLFKGDPVAVAKAGAIIDSINTVNAQIDDNYSGLSKALISKDPVAIAKAEAAAGVSQDLLISAVKSVAKTNDIAVIEKAGLTQAAVSQAVTDAVVSDPDLANANSIYKQTSGNLLQASLKSLAGKTAIAMDGVAVNPVTKDFDVSINYATSGDAAGAPAGALPGITAKDVAHKAISADDLNVTLNVTGQTQVNELAGVFAPANASLGALGIDHVNLNFADGDVANLLDAGSTLNLSINALATEGVDVSGTIDRTAQDALHLTDTQSTDLVLDGLHFAADDTIVLDVDASGTNLNTSLKQLQKLGVDAVSVAGGVDGINVDLGSDFNFSSMGGLPKFGDTNADGTLTATEQADLHVTLNATGSQLEGIADNASTFANAGIDQVAFDLTSEGQLQDLLNNDVALNQLVVGQLDAVVDFGSANVNVQSLGIDAQGDVTLEVAAAQGTHLSTSLKDLQKLGVDAVSVAGGVSGINVDLGSGFDFNAATGGVTLFGDANADGVLTAQEDGALHVTLNASSGDLGHLSDDAADFALAGVDEIFFDVGNEAGLTSLLTNQTALADLHNASLDVTVDIGGVHVGVDALHLDSGKITLDAEGASQGTHLSTSLKDLQKLGVDAVSVAGGVTELNLDLGSGSDAFSFSGSSVVSFEGDDNLRVTLSTTDAGQIDDLAKVAGNLHAAGIDAVNLDLSGQGGLNALLGTGTLSSEMQALDVELGKLEDAGVQAIVGISQDQAQEILKDAATFSFNADDTVVMHTDTAAQGTHLSTSLKDLQKLGVDAVSVAAGVTGINIDLGEGFNFNPVTGGVTLFGDTNGDGTISLQEDAALHVTLNASHADLVHLSDMSADASHFALAGVDEIFFNVGDEAGLTTLLADQPALKALEGASLDVTVDFGGVHVGVDALHLDSGKITLDAEGASHGTHLSTSLKDLQKLGVDAVSVAGGVGEISLNLGAGDFTWANGSVVNFEGDADLRVTLNSTDVGQLDDITLAATGLHTAGIDAVNLDLSGQGSLDSLLGTGNLVDEIALLDKQLDTLDHTGIQAIVGISDDQAQELVAKAADFTFDADITAAVHVDAATHGTHLSTSLKELQKLGVDAVSVAAGVSGINIDLGGSNDSFTLADGTVALFGDTNADGILSAQEDAALHVTLNTSDADLSDISADGNIFAAAGIDEVTFQLDATGLETLLGQSTELAALHVPNLDVTVDFGSVHVGVDALHLDDGKITLDAAGASHGTHLNTSLKDLQKLGIDAVSVAAGVHDINLNLGADTEGFQFTGGSDIRITGDEDLNVTLNVADASQLHDVAELAFHQVSNIGIDAVKLDLSGQGNLDTLLGAGTLKHDFAALEADLLEVHNDGLQSILGIDQVQAGELLAHGLNFQAQDTIVLNASVDASQGTHLSTSLKDLQKLGVDAISVAAGTAAINVDMGTGFNIDAVGGIALFGDTNADGTLTAQEADALHVTLNATGADLAALSAGDNASQFALAGIDEVSFKLDAQGLETLLSTANADELAALSAANLDVTVDFGSAHVSVHDLSLNVHDDVTDVVMHVQGSHLNTSLKDLQKLGVDAVSVAAGVSEINLDLGSDHGFQIQAGSLPAFDSQDIQVTLNVADAGQVDELANFIANDGSLFNAGIDAVKLDLAGEGSLDALLGRGQLGADFAALEADLATLRGDGVDSVHLDTIVAIDQAQAQQLVNANLHFNGADDVFLNASAGAHGTHLSTSLKDLQKLGIDAVSVAAGTTAINLDLGSGFDTNNADGFTSTGGIALFGDANHDGQLSVDEDNGLHVTLNALSGDLANLSSTSSALNTAGIDEISFTLNNEADLESLLGSSNLNALNNIALNHIDATVDFGSSHINVKDLSYNSADDKITYDLSHASQGTHLNTSLKDLQKLGVDAITVGAAVSDISLDLGSAFSLSNAQFQDASLPVFSGGTDLHVTLNVADATQLDAVAALHATDLLASGIDAVKWDLSGEGSLDTLLGRGLLSSDLSHLEASLASVRDNTALDTVIGIDQSQAHELLSAGLNFTFDSHDTALLNASAGAHGTHLSTSLKDLQKLGIDAVTVAAGVGEISVSLGADSLGALSATGMPVFGDTNADGSLSLAEDNALKVTLDVADLTQMGQVSALDNHVLSDAGIDAVRLDLIGSTFDLSSASEWTNLENALSAVRADSLDAIVGIDLNQAADLIGASFAHSFAAADTITLDASAGGHGTHLSTSLKDLQRLGVDAVSFDHDVKSIQVDGTDTHLLSATDIPEFNSALDVTLNLDKASLPDIGVMSKSLAEAGIDHLGVFSSDVSGADTLSALFGKLDSGLDITLKVDEAQTWTAGDNFALHGIDLLAGFHLDSKATWGDLIQTLHDSGLGHVQLQESANVTIDDDLSAALYESGMLQALPEAAITIQANTALLNTSLKAMADLGVDSVSGEGKLYVELGIKPEDVHTLADMHDLFSAFGLDHGTDHSLFAQNQQAGLVIDQTTFSSLGAVGVQELVGELSKLGFTELDVVGKSQADGAHVYEINVTAQTPVLSQVQVLGSADLGDLAHVFDPDILKNHK